MTEKRYLRERIYLIRKKLGDLEISLRWPLPAGKSTGPECLSVQVTGRTEGGLRSGRVDIPVERIPELLALEKSLEAEPPTGLAFRFQGDFGGEKLWLLELHFLGERLQKPWEFRVYTAEGSGELLLSEPIRFRISRRTMGNLLSAVAEKWAEIPGEN